MNISNKYNSECLHFVLSVSFGFLSSGSTHVLNRYSSLCAAFLAIYVKFSANETTIETHTLKTDKE